MKTSTKNFALVTLLLVLLACALSACIIQVPPSGFTITSPQDNYTIKVGDEVDFTRYFTVTEYDTNKNVTVTDSMITVEGSTAVVGVIKVTCSMGGNSKTITFTVEGENPPDDNPPDNPPDDVSAKITTTFSSAQLDVEESDGLTFTANPAPINFVEGRGLQFTQANGEVTLTSEKSLTGVKNVTMVVQTNQTKGMAVALSVGESKLTVDGNETVTVQKTNYTELVYVTFTADTTATGKVVIRLTPTASDKSMYILQIIVNDDKEYDDNNVTTPDNPPDDTPDKTPVDLSTLFASYDEYEKWNFEVAFGAGYEGDIEYYYYGYDGWDTWLKYDYDGYTYYDYLVYENDVCYLYADMGDGTHYKMGENDEDFWYFYYFDYLDLTLLGTSQFYQNGNNYSALSPSTVGDNVLGEDTEYGAKYVSFDLYVENGKIVKIEAVQDDGWSYVVKFSKYGTVTVNVDDLILEGDNGGNQGGGEDGGEDTPTGMMPTQSYDQSNHDYSTLNDKLRDYDEKEGYDHGIGLPTVGTYDVLVVPVQFKNGDTFTDVELSNLDLAFNGTAEQTGWESVKTYYQKSSYGKLNMSFDVYGTVFNATNNYTYYKEHTIWEDGYEYIDGTEVLLDEVLAWLEAKIDLAKYDTNGDGYIDAVYLIYCEDVDYRESYPEDEVNPEFFWAYVTWSYSSNTFDGVYPYFHMFAGVDFVLEEVTANSQMKINAETFIHETGHLLGLDDYYDYYPEMGSNEGVGGADMMDYTVGDHNAYSKIMLGWVTPTVVTSSQQLTIELSTASQNGGVIMLLLDYDGSYFCEYLLIEFYSATGLNQFHAGETDNYLFEGASFGVKIYHVSSSCKTPYNDEYGSFTDNNNSVSQIPLLKLIEADGDDNFESEFWTETAGGDDLWQTGDVFSQIQPNYTRNDGKLINFDITFLSVTETGATIDITFVD